MSIDISGLQNDYLYFDGLEDVTLRQAGTTTDLSSISALKQPISEDEIEASNGAYTRYDHVWFINAGELTTFNPEVGGRITDSNSTNWTILEVSKSDLTGSFRCVGRDRIINDNLKDTIRIEEAILGPDKEGENVETGRMIKHAALRAKIQPRDINIEARDYKEGKNAMYDVFIDDEGILDELSIEGYMYVVEPSADVEYRIRGVKNPSKITDLPAIICDRVT